MFVEVTLLTTLGRSGYEATKGVVNLDHVAGAEEVETSSRGTCTRLTMANGGSQLVLGGLKAALGGSLFESKNRAAAAYPHALRPSELEGD